MLQSVFQIFQITAFSDSAKFKGSKLFFEMVFVSFHSQKLRLKPRTLKVILVLVYKLDLVILLEDFESYKVY